MGGQEKKTLGRADIEHEISSRRNIIEFYEKRGYLAERMGAVRLILELQERDRELMIATEVMQTADGSIDLNTANDRQLVKRIEFQLDYLENLLLELENTAAEGNNELPNLYPSL